MLIDFAIDLLIIYINFFINIFVDRSYEWTLKPIKLSRREKW